MTGAASVLVLSGAVGAMALGAAMVYFVRRRDFVALWLGLFLLCVSASLLLGRDDAAGRWNAYLALPFLAGFVAELHPGSWQRRAALALAFMPCSVCSPH